MDGKRLFGGQNSGYSSPYSITPQPHNFRQSGNIRNLRQSENLHEKLNQRPLPPTRVLEKNMPPKYNKQLSDNPPRVNRTISRVPADNSKIAEQRKRSLPAVIETKSQNLEVKNPRIIPNEANEDDFPVLLAKYLETVDSSLKNLFPSEAKEIISECNTGEAPRWLHFFGEESGNEPIGLAAISKIDSENEFQNTQITYLTTVNRIDYKSCLKELVKYIWNKDDCDCIVFSVAQTDDSEENKGVDAIIKECGFKWQREVNGQGEKKRIEYSLKRPADCPCAER